MGNMFDRLFLWFVSCLKFYYVGFMLCFVIPRRQFLVTHFTLEAGLYILLNCAILLEQPGILCKKSSSTSLKVLIINIFSYISIHLVTHCFYSSFLFEAIWFTKINHFLLHVSLTSFGKKGIKRFLLCVSKNCVLQSFIVAQQS